MRRIGSRSTEAVLVASVIVAALSGCGRAPADELDVLYSKAEVTRGTVASVVVMAGPVAAVNARLLTVGASSGRVLEVLAHPGQAVQEGQPLVHLDTRDLERRQRDAEADLKVAEAGLAEAQRQAGELELAQAEADLTFSEGQVAVAELDLALAEELGMVFLQEAVQDAEVALRAARDGLHLSEIGANQSTIRSLEYDLAFHQRTLRDLPPGDTRRLEVEQILAEAQRDLDRARAQREETLRTAQAAVEKQEAGLAKASSALARARAGEENPSDAARLAYQQALANLETAQRTVDQLRAGVDSDAVRAAKAAYDAALAEVEGAEAALEAATLRTPFQGVVLAIYVQEGQQVQPSEGAVYLADLDDLRIQAQASEVDLPKLAVGQQVRVTFDAYPGKRYSGRVLSIPVIVQGGGGLTRYQVEVALEGQGPEVLLGMVANTRVLIGERTGVLTVPLAALIYRGPEDITVRVVDANGTAQEQEVEIGINDGILAEVLSGVSEGQTVLVPLVPPRGSPWDQPWVMY